MFVTYIINSDVTRTIIVVVVYNFLINTCSNVLVIWEFFKLGALFMILVVPGSSHITEMHLLCIIYGNMSAIESF